MSPCGDLTHAVVKATREAFDGATTPVGIMDDGEEERLILGNCKGCGSTLSWIEPTSGRREVVRFSL